jgi:tricorn protease
VGVTRLIRVTSEAYLRFPHLHGDTLAFVAEDDVWLAPVTGGRAWRLTSDGAIAAYPRFSPDGTRLAWTSDRDGPPEVYLTGVRPAAGTGPARDDATAPGGTAGTVTRLTWWADGATRTVGWTGDGQVLAISAADQPARHFTWAYALTPGQPPARLPYGPVADLALAGGTGAEGAGTGDTRAGGTGAGIKALVTGRFSLETGEWKRYRGGTSGTLWTATADRAGFRRIRTARDGQLGGVMIIDGRVVFASDHEGTANVYSCTPDGDDLKRHTDHDGFYVRHPASDGHRIVYQVNGEVWILDDLGAQARPVAITLGVPAKDRVPRLITASDHLGSLSVDPTGQASAVEVRGTVHWLTHKDGPARALHTDQETRARLPQVLGADGRVAFATGEGIVVTGEGTGPVTIPLDAAAAGLAASPDGATVAAATHDGKVWLVDVASAAVRQLAAGDGGPAAGLAFSPDSKWLAWAQPESEALARIRLAHAGTDEVTDVTDGRFGDSEPVFTQDGRYLAFLSRRSFDPVYDAQLFDMSFPYGARPYLVTLSSDTPSPFGPLPAGRPLSSDEEPEPAEFRVDIAGISSRVITVPVPEGRYSRLRPVKGGLAWLREPLYGVLGESEADVEADSPKPGLERFDLLKRDVTVLADEADWFEASGDGSAVAVFADDSLRILPSAVPPSSDGEPAVEVDLDRARFMADPAALWRNAFEEAGRLIRRDYWTPGLSGVPWDEVLAAYRPSLERVRCASEFRDLLWEVFGEVGTSHAYVYAPGKPAPGTLGLLGADIVRDADGRWTVSRVLPGESSDPRARSPLAAPGIAVRPGDVIVAIDGVPVDPESGPWPLLEGSALKPAELTVAADGSQRRVVVVPLRDQQRLRYQDWVAGRRRLVRSLSDGRLGYLHVPDMMGHGWSHFTRDLRPEMRHEGVILDVRGNGGGHISELVIGKIALRVLGWDVARWHRPESYPRDGRRGPLVTLADWAAGSDGDIVTAAIKLLGLGPVVGERTWGGVVGFDAQRELVDGTLITVPQLAFSFDEYGWSVENYGLDPDIECVISPEDWAAGRDPQLETAVRLGLEALDKQPASAPPDPVASPGPVKSRPPLPPRRR